VDELRKWSIMLRGSVLRGLAGIELIKLHRDRHAGSLKKESYPASHECRAGHW